jgi:hypothetical protein
LSRPVFLAFADAQKKSAADHRRAKISPVRWPVPVHVRESQAPA